MPDNSMIEKYNLESDGAEVRHTGFWSSFWQLSDWFLLICLVITIGIAVWSVQQADWIKPSPSFVTILGLSAFVGFIFAKSRLPAILAGVIALAIGIVVILGQGALILTDATIADKILHLLHDVRAWWRASTLGVPSPVTIHVALFFGYLTWIVGFFSSWALIRNHNPWIAIFLGTVTILANLNYWISEKYYYFLVYVVAALILIVLTTYIEYNSLLVKNRFKGFHWGPQLWMLVSLVMIMLAVSCAWKAPDFRVNQIADWARTKNPVGDKLQLYWQNFFATVPGYKPILVHGGQKDIIFGGSLELSEQVVFIVSTDHKNYWKTQVYDYYNSSGWKTSATSEVTIGKNIAVTGPVASSAAEGNYFSYVLIPQVNTDVLLSAGDFISADISLVKKSLNPLNYEINLRDSSGDSRLPSDIASTARSLRTTNNIRRRTDQQLAAALPAGLKLVAATRDGVNVRTISVTRDPPEEKPAVALSSKLTMAPAERAAISVRLPPEVTAESLAAVRGTYPMAITDRYLQLPPSLPARVKDLAASLTKDNNTEFMKTKSIKDYLEQFPYTLTIDSPPPDADGVDYFLFTQKSGYCTYFASAATVLLRAAGVPARMVVGYLPGQYDSEAVRYIIRDRDFHAWTEVYFPGYGWIEMDATPAGAVSEAPGDSIIAPAEEPDIAAVPTDPVEESSAPNLNFISYLGSLAYLIGIIVACIVLLLAFFIWFLIFRKPKHSLAIYSRMVLLASIAGLRPRPWQTVLEFSDDLKAALPESAPSINNVVQTYIASSYGGKTPATSLQEKLINSWPVLRNAFIKRFFHIK